MNLDEIWHFPAKKPESRKVGDDDDEPLSQEFKLSPTEESELINPGQTSAEIRTSNEDIFELQQAIRKDNGHIEEKGYVHDESQVDVRKNAAQTVAENEEHNFDDHELHEDFEEPLQTTATTTLMTSSSSPTMPAMTERADTGVDITEIDDDFRAKIEAILNERNAEAERKSREERERKKQQCCPCTNRKPKVITRYRVPDEVTLRIKELELENLILKHGDLLGDDYSDVLKDDYDYSELLSAKLADVEGLAGDLTKKEDIGTKDVAELDALLAKISDLDDLISREFGEGSGQKKRQGRQRNERREKRKRKERRRKEEEKKNKLDPSRKASRAGNVEGRTLDDERDEEDEDVDAYADDVYEDDYADYDDVDVVDGTASKNETKAELKVPATTERVKKATSTAPTNLETQTLRDVLNSLGGSIGGGKNANLIRADGSVDSAVPDAIRETFTRYFERLKKIFELDLKLVEQLSAIVKAAENKALPSLATALRPQLISGVQGGNPDIAQLLGYVTRTLKKSEFEFAVNTKLGNLDFINVGKQRSSLSDIVYFWERVFAQATLLPHCSRSGFFRNMPFNLF